MPMDEAKMRFRADPRSGGSSSSTPPDSAESNSSVASSSTFCDDAASIGTRNPVRYQREGDCGKISSAAPKPGRGPTRSSSSDSTNFERTSAEVIGLILPDPQPVPRSRRLTSGGGYLASHRLCRAALPGPLPHTAADSKPEPSKHIVAYLIRPA